MTFKKNTFLSSATGTNIEDWHESRQCFSTYSDTVGNRIEVNHSINSTQQHVLRTEANMIEAVLGQRGALSHTPYGLQVESVKTTQLAENTYEEEIEKIRAAIKILAAKVPGSAKDWTLVSWNPFPFYIYTVVK